MTEVLSVVSVVAATHNSSGSVLPMMRVTKRCEAGMTELRITPCEFIAESHRTISREGQRS